VKPFGRFFVGMTVTDEREKFARSRIRS
jgi:hypothetical protein